MQLRQRLETLGGDVRLAIRQLKASPAFTLVAVATLALGIGVNSAIFALADAALLRPLPFADPGQLVMVWERTASSPRSGVSPLNLRDFRQQSRSFEGLEALFMGAGGGPLVTAPDGSIEPAERQTVTTDMFAMLRVNPILGRTFAKQDEGERTSVVIFGESLWRNRFGGDPSIVGKVVRLNGAPYTVIGVIGDAVQFSRPAQMWTLSPTFPENPRIRTARGLEVVGRLKPGVTIEAAQAEMSVIAARLAKEYPEANAGGGALLEPLRNGVIGRDLQTTTLFLLGTVAFVLLMCCANVANLLLARASSRARELAVRSALGAERGRLIAQLLTESLVLALVGGALGILVGAAILKAAPALVPPGLLPAAIRIGFDLRVVLFGIAASVLVGVIFGLMPAWHATGTSLVSALGSESRSSTSAAGRLRGLLVSGEVAAAVLLLCGAGLLLQTLLTIVRTDPGYRAESPSVLTLDFSLRSGPGSRHPTPESVLLFYDEVAREMRGLPEIRNVGWSSSLPYGTSEFGSFALQIVGDPEVDFRERPQVEYAVSDPGYFRTLDLPIVMGRGISDRDTLQTPLVCVVSEAFARRHFAGRSPIGVRIALQQARDFKLEIREIVGVVRQVSGNPADSEATRQVYVPLAQRPFNDVYMVVQPSTGRAEALTPLVRRVVARHDPDVPVRRDRTLERLSIGSSAGYRFRATMVGTFASLALVLAMVGVFGVLAYAVQQRQREIGVRMALGATTARVVWLVFRDAGWMIASGALVGGVAAALSGQAIAAFLIGVEPLDPLTFALVAGVIGATALVASAAPAWRASRINPVVAFRNDG
jgi:putative ABC transport system permease protein